MGFVAFWMAAASVWCVLQLLWLSWPARTVGWPTVLLAFGIGAYGCGVLSVLIETVVTRQLAAADETSMRTVMDTVMWTTAPAAEELLKILPLALAAWALRGRVQWGLTDFVVLGAAVGVGFGLLESVLQFAFAPDVRVRPIEPAGGWSVATRLFEAPFVSGFPELLGHWFPAAVGTLELGSATATVPVDNHVAWSALGGLAVGLVVCGHRWWVRAAGLLPLLAAVGLHTAVNYIAALPSAHGTPREWYDRIVASGLWVVLGCLAAAVVWDVRTRRAGRSRETGVRLRGEREDEGGGGSGAALLNYALLRAPWTALIALGYARRRRALLQVTTHPRARPEHVAALRDELTARTAELDATATPEAWRGTSIREAWRRVRARGAGRLPWWEKAVLILGLALLIPSALLAATFAFEETEGLEEYFTEGRGWQLLIGCGLAGLLLAAFRLVMTWRSLPLVRTLPTAEPHAAALLRMGLVAGSLCAGALLLSRADTIAENGKVLPDHLIVSFVLEKFLDVAPALILTLLMFALPFALPLGAATGGLGFLLPELLTMAAGRALAPLAARAAAQVGARLAGRGALAWARNALRSGRGRFTRRSDEIRHGPTDPVDMATGRMFLPVTDVELPGVLPLVFSRRVDSGYRGGRWFGPSWASTADQRLEFDEHGAVFFTQDGLLLAYPHPAPGGAAVLPEDSAGRARWPLARAADGSYTVTDPDAGQVHTFTAHADSGVALLRTVTDRHGNRIAFTYDAEGAPVEIAHSGGYVLRLTTAGGRITGLWLGEVRVKAYGYDAEGRLTQTYNSSDLPLRFAYDTAGRVTSWTDTNNRSYTYEYGGADDDRVVAEGGEGGHYSFRLAYDGSEPSLPGLTLTTLTAPDGATTRYLIDERHLVVGEIDANGAVSRTAFDRAGRVTAETDPLGRTTEFRYDEHGRLTGVRRPDGSTVAADLDTEGRPVRITDPAGQVWHQTFDAVGNRTSVTDPTGATTRFLYDGRGAPLALTDPLGATTRVRCDAAGLPVETTDPLGATTRLARDAFGRIVTLTDPLGAVTRFEWSTEGLLLRRTGPDGAAESWTYDGEGNTVTYTDANGGVTHHEYTHFDLLTARTGPDGARHSFTHDAATRLTGVTNPQGLTWSYSYDAAGHLMSETDFDGRTVRYALDAAAQLVSRVDSLGVRTDLRYDLLGRLVAQDAGGLVTTFDWTAGDDLARATGPDAELLRTYDPAGRLLTETVDGRELRLSYDAAGRLSGRRTPAGAVTTYAYDAAGNRTELTASGRSLTVTRDAAGRETRLGWGDALSLTQTWDAAGRPRSRSYAGAAVPAVAYTWRPDGHLLAAGDARYTLDPAGRVTEVRAAADWSESYAYDTAGNQTEAAWPAELAYPEATGPRTHTGTRVGTAGTVRYEYDAAGRTTLRQKPRLSRKPDNWRYTWDARDQLAAVTTPDGTTWRYAYDALGRRVSKQRLAPDGSVAQETRFTYQGTTLIEETSTSTDWTGTQTLTWDHDESTLTPLAQTTRYAASRSETDTRFYAIVTDLIGTPTHLIDESGTTAWRARRTLWGTTTWPPDATAYTPLRFPGQYHDLETGHHYNLHRHYDPESTHYLTPDPLGLAPSPNPTAYVHNPLTWCDPLGLAPDCGGVSKGRAAQRYGRAYEDHLVTQLRGVGNFKEGGRDFDGAYIDELTGRGIWYEAKSGDFWENILKNPTRLDKFYSTEGQKLGIAKSKGIDYEIITEKSIPAPVANWLAKKGIPWRIHPGPE
ncbi:DUF6531 domain-containing protein [Streptomyces sp. IB2014 016-6]|uniref:DUF6531 domain-containing protein n=1 Tax=Streptomyces sp. IB2014 016-6 TaxID=2517818 RepID=UPI0011C8011B|nr:DUF6531 domain-containing protein [Streptomyces sp. IB2014 016-6]TXL87361.1 PrsW family intramembrane metalloprotease [Streptomyces sp. IB2014 016-6]